MNNLTLKDIASLRFLLAIDGIGPGTIINLIKKFRSFENILSATPKDFDSVERVSSSLFHKIGNAAQSVDYHLKMTEKELHKIEKMGGSVISLWDDKYPLLLKNVFYPPLLLYILGNVDELSSNCVAIVGTRTPTDYGKIWAGKFTTELCKADVTIVSGLARGIDSIAHETAIKSGGKTIAVIGSGLDVIYPPENSQLFKRIKDIGCVISEFPLGTKPDAQNFPKRNRIISGLSLGTLVIETRCNGGAIQTAAHALNQNREVFAIPGNLGVSQSEGTNLLIKRSEAKLVQNADDILNELNLTHKHINRKPDISHLELSLFEEKIFTSLTDGALHIDELSEKVSIDTSECLVYLLQLEFKGLVRQLPGKMFISVD